MDLQAVKRRYNIIGNSEKLNHALATAIRVANTDLTVLIQGESGVGKEVFSKLIHQLSKRKHNEFIALNCAAIPAGTINSELFGHEKGAFTGASSERKGYFETVNGGTIFLDEVGEMPLDTQAYLLRVLENGEFLRVGSSKVRKTDVRVIAATNVDLKIKVKEKKFREDLYYRLNTVPIYIPPLRERPEDIIILFKKFARDIGEKYNSPTIQLDDEAKILLLNYSWPGNIRELKNVVEKLSILSDDRVITAEKLIYIVPEISNRNLPVSVDKFENEKINDRDLIYKFLFDMKNDITELKSMFYNLVHANDLLIPADHKSLYTEPKQNISIEDFEDRIQKVEDNLNVSIPKERAIIVPPKQDSEKYEYEIMDESLNLADMEKNLIIKALKKYNGKRRKAAQELGVSERT
ncbi:MAG TPA: sigma-54-dependent Fis family transcriptional regulator, partial [Bacteroidetes bacterium]|nr:sigma-54-dependent Fis family transcriptional regulator [Bacteroidota bacterium]